MKKEIILSKIDGPSLSRYKEIVEDIREILKTLHSCQIRLDLSKGKLILCTWASKGWGKSNHG
jgi:hypothetical protein